MTTLNPQSIKVWAGHRLWRKNNLKNAVGTPVILDFFNSGHQHLKVLRPIYQKEPLIGSLFLSEIINTSPSVSVALRRIGATHLKLTADMRPYSSLFLPCRMLYMLLSTNFHSVNFVPIRPVES